jgi:hypothetical protein
MQQAPEKLADSIYPVEVFPEGMRRRVDIHLDRIGDRFDGRHGRRSWSPGLGLEVSRLGD